MISQMAIARLLTTVDAVEMTIALIQNQLAAELAMLFHQLVSNCLFVFLLVYFMFQLFSYFLSLNSVRESYSMYKISGFFYQ